MFKTSIYCPPSYNHFCHFHSQTSLAHGQHTWHCTYQPGEENTDLQTACFCVAIFFTLDFFQAAMAAYHSITIHHLIIHRLRTQNHSRIADLLKINLQPTVSDWKQQLLLGSFIIHVSHFHYLTSVWQDTLTQ